VVTDYSDEVILVSALRARDELAFAWLLDHYDASMRRVARSFVSNAAVVDEVVQETWLGVIRGIDRFEGRSSVKTWIFRILMNISRSRGAREARTVPFTTQELAPEDSPSFAPDRFQGPGDAYPRHWLTPPQPWDEQPGARLMSVETVELVRDAIEQLPRLQRSVITLRDIEGCSGTEVCSLLELTEANQRVLLHRARARVRQVLEDHFAQVDA
jgi:RNA polymerase sigma-70 factor (ECF subfamily)